jgi:hypothetical protein
VHRKDNSARFKEMDKWMDTNLTGEGVGVKAKASATIQSPRGKDKQDREVHLVPFKKGIKMMSERESVEVAEHGEDLRWSTDSGEDEYPQIQLQSVGHATNDSEEPTELGVVWERAVRD